jgi:hypothetical protein
MKRCVLLILAALVLQASWAAGSTVDCAAVPPGRARTCLLGEGWELVQDEDGVQVFTRDHPGSSVREVLARTRMSAPPKAVMDLLTDFDGYTRFMPATLERSKLLARENSTYYVFQQLALPFVDDRFYTIRLETRADPAGQGLTLSWRLSDDPRYRVQGRGSPLKVNDGYWALRAADSGRATDATYFVHTDPGRIWAFVANLANRVSVPDMVKTVRRRVERRGAP